MKIKLTNFDDSNFVTVTALGPGIAAKAKAEFGSIEGSRWEASDSDCAYAIIDNRPGLVADLEKEGYDVDDSELYSVNLPSKSVS